ncbi:MAG: methyl-accepting chemotaxis protein [Oscillospiraceae bacterium]
MKKQRGLDKKIILFVSALTAVMLIISSVVSYLIAYKMVSSESEAKIINELSHQATKLDGWLDTQEAIVTDVAKFSASFNPQKDDLQKILKAACETSDGTMYAAYLAYPINVTIFNDDTELPPDFIVMERGWYKDAEAAGGKSICTTPYIDFNTGSMIITVATAGHNEDGSLYAIAGGDVYIDELIKSCEEIKISDNAYPFLIDDSGNILVHTNDEYLPKIVNQESVFTNAADIPAYSEQFEMGKITFKRDFDGTKRAIGTVQLSNGWTLGYAIDYTTYMKGMVSLVVIQLVIMIVCVVLVTILCAVVVKNCLKPVDELSVAAEQMAQGNLSYQLTYHGNDSVGVLSEKLSATNTALKGYIDDISQNLSRMKDGDFSVSFGADYVGDFAPIKASIEQISKSIGSVIEGISSASEKVNNGAKLVSQTATALSTGANEQTETVDRISNIAETIKTLTEENGTSADKALAYSRETGEAIAASNESMKELLDSMKQITEMSVQIEEIIKTIDDIAFQTNILALNASIEAARAGAAGKGFAVVADEVRNLASKSAEAVNGTTELINSTTEAIEKGSEIANATATSLEAVTKKSKEVDELVARISKACGEQRNSVADINEKIEVITAVAERNSATAEESAASSEELNTQARTLNELLDGFKLQ